MGSASRSALVVATSIGALEALKDQGFCKWSVVLRSIQRHAKSNLRSFSQANNNNVASRSSSSSSSSVVALSRLRENEGLRQSEESMKKVMYLSCWGS